MERAFLLRSPCDAGWSGDVVALRAIAGRENGDDPPAPISASHNQQNEQQCSANGELSKCNLSHLRGAPQVPVKQIFGKSIVSSHMRLHRIVREKRIIERRSKYGSHLPPARISAKLQVEANRAKKVRQIWP